MAQWKRVLITGAAGFLGSHLTDAVLAEGAEVVGVDNLCTGSLENLAHLKSNSKFSFEQHDICKPFDFGSVDVVFNFASPASPVDYMKLGPETLRVGSDGTVNALEVAKKYGAGFLHASTSECYGDPEQHPQKETYWGNVNPIGPRSVYDEAKRFSEATIMAYHNYYKVRTSMVRIFNTYGPRLQPNDGRVISNLMMQALSGQDLTVYGDGSQTRSFCFQSDLVRGIVALAKSGEPLPTNIGNPEEWTILECAKTVLEVTGATSKIVYRPMPQDDPKQRKPDITKAQQLLGWEPEVNLREGLMLSMDYFKERVAANGQLAGVPSRRGGMADAMPLLHVSTSLIA
ncbi:MAG: UDP-glucuronic acid decarboxylase family protein [Terriglobus sp.]